MSYFVSDVHEEDLESNYLKSRAGDEDDETVVGLVADFSRWADDVSEMSSSNKKTDYRPDFGLISFVSSNNLSLRVKALPDAKPTATVAVECKKTARSRTTGLNQSQGSMHKSASVPVVSASSWTKQELEQDTSPPTKRARTWQEISSEINRFAEDSMRNAGWDDLWTCKKKAAGEADASLSYLSTQSLQAIRKAEMAFQGSLESQQKLQAWDKMMGLKRCHSRTMTKSSVTRKKLLQLIEELKIQKEMTEINEGQIN